MPKNPFLACPTKESSWGGKVTAIMTLVPYCVQWHAAAASESDSAVWFISWLYMTYRLLCFSAHKVTAWVLAWCGSKLDDTIPFLCANQGSAAMTVRELWGHPSKSNEAFDQGWGLPQSGQGSKSAPLQHLQVTRSWAGTQIRQLQLTE